MERSVYVTSLRRDGEALLDHARAAGLDAPVPTCPGWDVRRLVRHMAKVHQRTEVLVRTRAEAPPASADLPRFAEDEALFDEAAEVLEKAVATLADSDPDGFAWTFTGQDRNARFWWRRMAHETAVHRLDAERAAGAAVTPVPTDLAVDGIDELATVLLPHFLTNQPATFEATVHLHCTDAEGEWMLAFAGGGVTVTRDHGKGDLAVRGPASGLFLWAWDRVAPGDAGLETFGDDALLAAWASVVP